jgi:hypothetical protein
MCAHAGVARARAEALQQRTAQKRPSLGLLPRHHSHARTTLTRTPHAAARRQTRASRSRSCRRAGRCSRRGWCAAAPRARLHAHAPLLRASRLRAVLHASSAPARARRHAPPPTRAPTRPRACTHVHAPRARMPTRTTHLSPRILIPLTLSSHFARPSTALLRCSALPGDCHLFCARLPLHPHRRQVPRHIPLRARPPRCSHTRTNDGSAHAPKAPLRFLTTLFSLLLQVVEVSARYDQQCERQYGTDVTCLVTLTVPRAMVGPIFVYYEINGMYLNHRRMVLSRSDDQLRGADDPDTSTCKPQLLQNGAWQARSAKRAAHALHARTFSRANALLLSAQARRRYFRAAWLPGRTSTTRLC